MPLDPVFSAADRVVAESCRLVIASIESGEETALAFLHDAVVISEHLVRTLDPRTPPAEVGRALILVGSRAAHVVSGLHDDVEADVAQDAVVVLNMVAMTGFRLLDQAGEIPSILAATEAGGPS